MKKYSIVLEDRKVSRKFIIKYSYLETKLALVDNNINEIVVRSRNGLFLSRGYCNYGHVAHEFGTSVAEYLSNKEELRKIEIDFNQNPNLITPEEGKYSEVDKFMKKDILSSLEKKTQKLLKE